MKGLKAMFKVRATYIGIAAAIMFQLIFFTVWMTAYDGVNDRTGNLRIGVVNEDSEIGQQIADQIKDSLPFTVSNFDSIIQAKDEMNERNMDMIIQIPSNFSELFQTGEDANIIFWINQANASLSKTIMENTAFQVTDQVNRSFYTLQKAQVAGLFTQQLGQFPIEKETSVFISDTVTLTLNSLKDQPILAEIQKTNAVEDFASNLVPLMVIISSFVGAMVMVMQHEEAALSIRQNVTKWQLFLGRQIIVVVVAFLLPLVTISLMGIFDISSQISMLTVYYFQAVLFLAFISLAQVFVVVFGNLGMIFNILALSLQLVTSGVLVPKALLSDFFAKVGTFLPATYGADVYYTIVFGGSSSTISNSFLALFLIISATMLVSFGAVAMKRTR